MMIMMMSHTQWLNPTSLGPPARQVLQQSLPLLPKRKKYASIGRQYLFAPTAVETFGPLNTSVCHFLANLGRNIFSISGDDRAGAFLFQRVSVLVQRYNAVLLLHDTLPATDYTDC